MIDMNILNNPYKYVDENGLWAVFFQCGGSYGRPGAGASVSGGLVISYSKIRLKREYIIT